MLIGARIPTPSKVSAVIQPALLEILRDQFEILDEGTSARFLERLIEAVTDVIVDQRLLRTLDRALHCLQLLGDLGTGTSLFEHLNDGSRWPLARFRRRAIAACG
jgi:hypothetical protein